MMDTWIEKSMVGFCARLLADSSVVSEPLGSALTFGEWTAPLLPLSDGCRQGFWSSQEFIGNNNTLTVFLSSFVLRFAT